MKGKILTYLIGLLVLLTGVSETYKIIPEKLSVFDGQNLQVKTSNGPVKGFLATTCRSQMKFVGFRGIPYAKPPLGELRFKVIIIYSSTATATL